MKLVLRRAQRQNLLGIVIFSLEVRADMTADERDAIWHYRLSDALLYEKYSLDAKGTGAIGRFIVLLVRLAHHAINTSIRARDLAEGKQVQCNSIAEMVGVEEHIKEQAAILGELLTRAIAFNGEEAIPI